MNKFLICRFLVGVYKNKIIESFLLKLCYCLLELNAVCETKLKSVDYKSIALPAELQGRSVLFIIYSLLIKIFFYLVYMKKNNRCTIRYI